MNEVILLEKNQIETASIDDLKAELSRTLKVTSQYLVYMALIWSELNKRGVDLSALRSGLFEYIPLIATNQLNPDLVIEFAGNKTLLSALSRIPIEHQNWIAETKQVAFVKLGDKQERIDCTLDLTRAKASEIYQVFGGENGLRTPDQQYELIKSRQRLLKNPKNPKNRKERKTLRSVQLDEDKEYVLLGTDAKVKIETLIDALNKEFQIDLYEYLKKHSEKFKNIR